MLKYNNVSAFYGKKKIINNFSAHFKKGDVTTVLGVNGSGKTTLFSLLLGNIKYNGEIFLKGINIKDIPLYKKAQKISFLPQKLKECSFTVKELVLLGKSPYLSFKNKISKNDVNKALKIIEELKLTKYINAPVSKLSGGEMQRAYLAMILMQDTELLIFDEPISFSDPFFSNMFFSIVKKLKEKNKTIIIIMHNINKALEISDNILLLENGNNIFFNSVNNLIKSNLLEDKFSVKKYEVKIDNKKEYIYK